VTFADHRLFEIIQLNQHIERHDGNGTALAWLMADQLRVGA
jgi:hypothetical protein